MLKGGVSFYCFNPSRELGTSKRVNIGLGFPFYRGFCFIFRVDYCCCVGVLKAALEWLICKGQFITVCLLESADLLLLDMVELHFPGNEPNSSFSSFHQLTKLDHAAHNLYFDLDWAS